MDEQESELEQEVRKGMKIKTEASIVRIMKSYKTISHQQLIEQLIQQVSFSPTMLLIKECIEDLIEKEYLKRDGLDRSLYNYIA